MDVDGWMVGKAGATIEGSANKPANVLLPLISKVLVLIEDSPMLVI